MLWLFIFCTQTARDAPMTVVRKKSSELVPNLIKNRHDEQMSLKTVKNSESITKLKGFMRHIVEAHCKTGPFRLINCLLNHFVEYPESFGILNVLRAAVINPYDIHINISCGSTFQRPQNRVKPTVSVIENIQQYWEPSLSSWRIGGCRELQMKYWNISSRPFLIWDGVGTAVQALKKDLLSEFSLD